MKSALAHSCDHAGQGVVMANGDGTSNVDLKIMNKVSIKIFEVFHSIVKKQMVRPAIVIGNSTNLLLLVLLTPTDALQP